MKVEKTKKEEKKQNSDLGIIVEILKRKGLVAFASLGLLVSIIIMGTTAWYTKINDVSGITLNVAQFDFKADFTTEEFMLNAANSTEITVNNKTKITSVFISTKATSEGQKNEEMTGVLNLNGKEGKYFIRRVRTYDAKTYTDLFIEDALNEKDLAKSNKIYEIYLENKKSQPR